MMLGSADLIAFVPTRDPARAQRFYETTLGLEFISSDPFAAVFDAHGTTLRIANVADVKDFQPAPFTIVGWQVTSVSDRWATSKKRG
jgi:catechol 2,3-dioxygenase-like lactoylglutathione lyase family enzyme